MLKVENNKIEFYLDKCQQCGICEPVCPKDAINLKLRPDGMHDVEVDYDKCILCKKCVRTCPSNTVNDYTGYFDSFPHKKYFLGYNTDERIRKESSSGGVCKTIIIESLKSGVVDGVYTLIRKDEYPYAKGEFYTLDNIPDFDTMPNSVYHSVPACTEIDRIKKCRRLMIVGTSCQLRALETVVRTKCEELIKVCIFCKQQKTLYSTRFLAKVMGTKIGDNLKFTATYRGNGWPGTVVINNHELPWHRAAQVPFGRRIYTVPGCDICGDSFGTLANADITLMDPWNIRTHNELGETLVIAHTEIGHNLLFDTQNLTLEEITYERAEAALSLEDVERKQIVEPYFRGVKCSEEAEEAGNAEKRQRKIIREVVDTLPKMPMLFYRILCKLPDLRNKEISKYRKKGN